MKAGVFLYAQNSWDNERFAAFEADPTNASLSKRNADNDLWQELLRFGELIEPLGFDDIWTVEHHFSPYAETTNTLQFLAYWAGRTERVGMGTMVIVLPWHDPVRVAEEMIALQYMLGDRDMTLGFGRGSARREYGGLGIPQGESRERFDESVQIIKLGLTQERFSFEGKHYTIPDVSQRPQSPHLSLRPTPLDPQRLIDNFYGAWGSPGSAPLLAAHGLKPLIIPQRVMTEYESELAGFYDAGTAAGYEPANPVVAQWVYCSEGSEGQERGYRAYNSMMASADLNYEFSSHYHQNVPGYEQYALMDDTVEKAIAANPHDNPLAEDMVCGTPDQCIAKIQEITDLLHPRQWNFDFMFGDVGYEEAQKSMKLFAKEVLPFVHELPVLDPLVGVASA